MWAMNLNHLKQIAIQRHERLGGEPHGYVLWSICELDMYACLLGKGNCDFFYTIMQRQLLPSLDQQIPQHASSPLGPYFAEEAPMFPAILAMNQSVMIRTAQMAQMAQKFRTEAANHSFVTADTYARWQASVARFQIELRSAWEHNYPAYLSGDSLRVGQTLPVRVRYVFEHVSFWN